MRRGTFLERPAIVLGTIDLPLSAERPGETIGRYKLLEEIGEGGMGVVYMAEQQEPVRRKVALKIIKPGMDTRQVIARFEAERQALAIMDHPEIARVFDAGATDSGRPYFVMELVRGVPLTDYCDQNQLTTRERLELFIPVCHAVAARPPERDHPSRHQAVQRPGHAHTTACRSPRSSTSASPRPPPGSRPKRRMYTGCGQIVGTPALHESQSKPGR